MTILCVTFNPAVDRMMVVPEFSKGGVFRPKQMIVAPGGKGVNVARAVHMLGGEALCAGFLGGSSGRLFQDMLDAEGLKGHWTWLNGGETRTCVILADPDHGITTVINEPGPVVHTDDWHQLREDVLQASVAARFVSLCGSLPPGSPVDGLVQLAEDLIDAGKKVWADTSGAALEALSLVRGVAIKVNDEEAAALTGKGIRNVADAVSAARTIYNATDRCVLITIGAQGAVFADGHESWHAVPPSIPVKSGFGSGDSFMGGLLTGLVRGEPVPAALAQATAAGTANALSVGGGTFTRAEFEDVLRETRVARL